MLFRRHTPVLRPVHQETTSLGAALAAGLALGFYTEAAVFKHELVEGDTEFLPKLEGEKREALIRGWRRAVERSFNLASPAHATEDTLGLGAVGGSVSDFGGVSALDMEKRRSSASVANLHKMGAVKEADEGKDDAYHCA